MVERMQQYSHFNLADWLSYLENRLKQEIKLGLSRVRKVAKLLNLTPLEAKVITIAGTNGKGSTVAALESIYRHAGYQVASYTSPHLLIFNERIRINQQAITDKELCNAFFHIEKTRGSIPLTYFETVTLAALWYFKQHKLDIIILEVGLGGRLDATNIIDGDLAVITTIDLDHQQYLGDTKEKIAQEKAGILRAKRPFIFADKNPPQALLNKALSLGCESYFYGREYSYQLTDNNLKFLFQEKAINFPRLPLHANSIAAAVMASLIMEKFLPLTNSQVLQGVQKINLPGRLQLLKNRGITTLFDVSHNPQAVNYLADFLRNCCNKKRIHAVFSALKDKEIAALLAPLMDLVDSWYPAMLAGKRAATKIQLQQAFSSHSQTPYFYPHPLAAYNEACKNASADDLIIVYGSFITVGNILSTVYNCSS